VFCALCAFAAAGSASDAAIVADPNLISIPFIEASAVASIKPLQTRCRGRNGVARELNITRIETALSIKPPATAGLSGGQEGTATIFINIIPGRRAYAELDTDSRATKHLLGG
jgi:hypothetical protein